MIEACDKAFDKAKSYASRMAHSKQTAPKAAKDQPKPPEKKENTPMKHLTIKVDANQTRHSHILQLKQLFSQHPGATPIQIHFHAEVRSLAILHIESKWGITLNDQFKQKIGEMGFVLAIE